jgi:glc operon protein GlcG
MMMKYLLTAVAALAFAAPAESQTAAPSAVPPAYGAPIGLDAAEALIDRAVAAAKARGFRMAIAIVEPSGELVAFAKMDDTQYGSTYVAQRKAATAARYRQSTGAMEQRTLAGRTVTLANADSLPIAGGIPILSGSRIIGAIGVSGAAASEDEEIARAALAKLR